MTHRTKPSGRTAVFVTGPRMGMLHRPFEDAAETVGIIHDLGNLIQVASSAVNLMKRNANVTAAAEIAPFVAGATAALERAGVIVRQTIASAQNGSPLLEHVNVTASLAEIGNLILPLLNSNIRLLVRTDSDALAVTANRLELQNAILNLVFNAREAMPSGGVVSIFASGSYDGATGSNVEIRVTDTGVGMSPDLIGRVFEPYFTTKPGGVGGVGLHMVKRFAEDAGGSLLIASAPGAGTTVTMRLPAATALSAALCSALNPASGGDDASHQGR